MRTRTKWAVTIKKAGVVLGILILPALAYGAGTISLNVKDSTGTDKMVVTSIGQIGIGVANPVMAIDVKGTFPYQSVRVQGDAISGGAGFIGLNVPNDGTLPKADDRLGYFVFGSISGATSYHTAGLEARAASAWTSTSMPSYFTFATASDNTTGRLERMRISKTGNVGIGTANPGQKLEVSGGGIRVVSGSSKPACDSTSNGTIWFTSGASTDTLEICVKISGIYGWKGVAFNP